MKTKAAFVVFYAIQAANGSGKFSSSWAHMGQQKYEAAKIGKSGEQDYKSAFCLWHKRQRDSFEKLLTLTEKYTSCTILQTVRN